MLRLIAKILVTLAAITVMQLPTALLQLTAWSQMLADRIPDQGIEQAIHSTFDGSSPCSLCLATQEVQKTQQESDSEHTTTSTPSVDKFSRYKLSKVTPPMAPSGQRLKLSIPITFPPVSPDFQVPTPPPRNA